MKNQIESPTVDQIKVGQHVSVKFSSREMYEGVVIEVGAKTMIPFHSVRVKFDDYVLGKREKQEFTKACHPNQVMLAWEE